MRSFDGCKQKFDDNITLIEPLSTSISAIQISLDNCESQVKGIQNLRINNRLKALEQPIDDIHEQGMSSILESSISGHLDTLVTRTNLQIDKINALATEKMELMENIVVTMASTLNFAYNAKISLQQPIDTSQQ